jgi:hypothetical protein
MIRKALSGLRAQRDEQRQVERYRDLIRKEAKIGGELFGPVPMGSRREFFCLDTHTWVWHEEWTDPSGQRLTKTTRYDVRPSGVVKSQNGSYEQLSLQEAMNLRDAIEAYGRRVKTELYPSVA